MTGIPVKEVKLKGSLNSGARGNHRLSVGLPHLEILRTSRLSGFLKVRKFIEQRSGLHSSAVFASEVSVYWDKKYFPPQHEGSGGAVASTLD